jgi:2-dehydro-3-deoxyglucarate aldolase/4-hydroxy-2-oxoheptanedioate aldolase
MRTKKNYGKEWRARVRSGECVLGAVLTMPSIGIAEALACFGYECVWIDGEHGHFDKAQILSHLQAVNGAGAAAFVRVTNGDPFVMKPILEMGPDGIIIPMINTAADAEHAISGCTYPPRGVRGYGPLRARGYYSTSDQDYLAAINDSLVKTIQIEHKTGVDNIDEILAVQGVDAVIIGPYDLSASLGILGQVSHPEVRTRCEKVRARCKARGIPCGPSIGPMDDDIIHYWLDLKPDFLFCGDELSFIKTGTETTLAKLRKMME